MAHAGCMVAFYVPAEAANALAVEGGEPSADLHITLAYLGDAADLTDEQVTKIHEVTAQWSQEQPPLSADVSGFGVFNNNDEDVTYASVDSVGLSEARNALVDRLIQADLPVATNHGFTPHITLLYRTTDELDVPSLSFPLNEVSVMVGGTRNDFALEGVRALTAAGSNVIIDSLGRVWKPWLHPRDHNGRFIHTFGSVKFRTKKGGEFNDASGKVRFISPNGDIWVQINKALSPDAQQKFNKGDLVRVPKGDIEVLDSKARLAQAGRPRALNAGQQRRLRNNIRALRNAKDARGNPIPKALEAADLLEQADAKNTVLQKRLLRGRGPDQTPAKRAEAAAEVGELLEQAADRLDNLRGEGHSEGDQILPGQAGALETLYDNGFATATTLQGHVLGETKGRLQKGGLAQGQGQERDALPGDVELPGEETGVNVYKDVDGTVVDDPILQERAKVNKARVEAGQPELTSEEFVRDFVSNDRLAEPRAVNGLDRVAAVFRRGKSAPADRRMNDADGTVIQPGSIVQVDAGSGRGGGAWVRPAFTGVLVRVHVDKGGAKTAVVRDFRPDLYGTDAADRDPDVPKSYYEKGYHDYTRTASGSLVDVTPEDGNNYGILMANLEGEFGISYDELSKAMVEIGAERRYAGMNAGRLSELSRNGAIAITLRQKLDGNGRIIQQGDWVWTGSAYAQVVYLEPNSNTIGVKVGGEGDMKRLSSRNVAFAHGASGAVFGRNDIDAVNAAGMYAPTREEAVAVARRRGLNGVADALEAGASGDELRAAFESDPVWGAFSSDAINARGKFYDRAQRGLAIDNADTVKIQDSTILGAALSGVFRDGDDIPQQKIQLPSTPPEIDVPDAPQIPEGVEVPEGAKAILNPDSQDSVLVKDSNGDVTEWIRDPETDTWVNAGSPVVDDLPTGPIENVNSEIPVGFERRQNGRGRKDSFVTPDGRVSVTENKRGQLVVTDVSDPEEPDVIGVGDDWEGVLDIIEENAPDSLPRGESTLGEIYEVREDAARERLSELLGTDVGDMTPLEIADTDEFAEASTGEDYAKIKNDLNEIEVAEEIADQEQDAPVENPQPREEPVAPTEPVDPGLAQNIVDTLWNVSERMKADKRIPNNVVDAVASEILRMEDALEAGDKDAFETAIGQIIRNPGVPEPIRRGLGAQLQQFKRNGGFDVEGGPDGAPVTPVGAFADQAAPLDYAQITPAEGVDFNADVPAFIENFMDNFGDWLNNRIEADKVGNKFWTTEKQRAANKDTIKGVQEVHKRIKTALEDAELSDDERREAIDGALQRLQNIAGVRGEGAGIYRGLIQSLIDRNKSGYDLRAQSDALAGEDVADALIDDPIYQLAVSGEVEPDAFTVLDAEGNPVSEGFVAEYPESRLVTSGSLSEEDFNDYWENVAAPLFEEDESAAFIFTTDEEGNTVLTVGTWTEDETVAAEVAAGNGDAYYDGNTGNWVDPADGGGEPIEDPRIQEAIAKVEFTRENDPGLNEDTAGDYADVITALEDLENALASGDPEAIDEAARNISSGPVDVIIEDVSGLQDDYMLPDEVDAPNPEDEPEPEPEPPTGVQAPTGAGLDKMVESINRTGGYTIDLSTGQDSFDSGYAVSYEGFEMRLPKDEFDADPKSLVDAFIEQNGELLSEDSNLFGSWVEGPDGGPKDVVFDVSQIIDDRATAIETARENNQTSLFDFATGTYIYPQPDGTSLVKDGADNIIGAIDADGNDIDPPSPDEGPDDGGDGGGDGGGGGAAPGFSQEKTDAIAKVRASGSTPYVKAVDDLDNFALTALGNDVDVEPVAVYSVNPDVESFYDDGAVSTVDFIELDSADTEVFWQAVGEGKKRKFGSSVEQYESASDYGGYRLFLSQDGGSGFAISPDGNIVSAFSNGQDINAGAGDAILQLAIQNGGTRLDAFDTVLPSIYSRAGFVATGRTKFVDEFAPSDWDYDEYAAFNDGRPDVVFMALDKNSTAPYAPGDGEYFDDYDEASANNKRAADELNGEGNVRGDSGEENGGGDDGSVPPTDDGGPGGGGPADGDGRGGPEGGPGGVAANNIESAEQLEFALGEELAAEADGVGTIDLGDEVPVGLIQPKRVLGSGKDVEIYDFLVNGSPPRQTTAWLSSDEGQQESSAAAELVDVDLLNRLRDGAPQAQALSTRWYTLRTDRWYQNNPAYKSHETAALIEQTLTLDAAAKGEFLSKDQRAGLTDFLRKAYAGGQPAELLPDETMQAIQEIREGVRAALIDVDDRAQKLLLGIAEGRLTPLEVQSYEDPEQFRDNARHNLYQMKTRLEAFADYHIDDTADRAEFVKAARKIIDAAIPKISGEVLVAPFSPPKYDGDVTIDLPETEAGEVSLASVASFLLSNSDLDVEDANAFREAVGSRGINLPEGISIDPINNEVGGGINAESTYLIRAEGSDEKFVLKYDYPEAAYSEVAVPRVMAAAGVPTPKVQALKSLSNAPTGGVPFLQTWAGADLSGHTPKGPAEDSFDEILPNWPVVGTEASEENTPENRARARAALSFLWGNVAGRREDTHARNVVYAAGPNGEPTFIGIDNGFALNSNYASIEAYVERQQSSYYRKFAENFYRSNPDAAQEDMAQFAKWAEGLRTWYANAKERSISNGGLSSSYTRGERLEAWLDYLTELDNADLWDKMFSGLEYVDYTDPESYNFFTLTRTEVLA